MLRVTLVTFRHYLNALIEQGWIQTRTHPENTRGRKVQYRVNIRKLWIDLQKHKYELPRFETYGTLPASEQSLCEEQAIKKVHFSAEAEGGNDGNL